MPKSPPPNGSNGRDLHGRFAKGNAGGPGNPHGRKVCELRSALLDAVSVHDVTEIVRKMKQQAKKGDMAAVRELLDRLLGKSSQGVQLELTETGAQEQNEQLKSPQEETAEFIRFAARFCIPKMAWIPHERSCYEAWLEGRRSETRPPDYEQLVRLVEARCNWVRAQVPQLGRTRFALLTAEGQLASVEPAHEAVGGILDNEDASPQ